MLGVPLVLFLILVGALGLFGLAVLFSLLYFWLSDRDDKSRRGL
jgi:hypothetical protein